jgi:hypothetical protein
MTTNRQIFTFGTVALLFLPLTACNVAFSCTEIGCISGLLLNVTDANGEPAELLSGEVVVDGTVMTFDCATEENVEYCSDGLVMLSIEQGDFVEYNISIPRGDFAFGEYETDWAVSFPNGEKCPPECYNDEIEIVLEGPTTPE